MGEGPGNPNYYANYYRECYRHNVNSYTTFILHSINFSRGVVSPYLIRNVLSSGNVYRAYVSVFRYLFCALTRVFLPISISRLRDLGFAYKYSKQRRNSSYMSVGPRGSFACHRFHFRYEVPPKVGSLSYVGFSGERVA